MVYGILDSFSKILMQITFILKVVPVRLGRIVDWTKFYKAHGILLMK